MGSSLSSTSADRRNNALRRSQRKSITGACSNIDKLMKVIQKFNDTSDSEEYRKLKLRINQIERNLQQKSKELQPQFKAIHDITLDKIKTAYALLDRKAKECSEIMKSKDIVPKEDEIESQIENTEDNTEEAKVDENQDKTGVSPAQSPASDTKRNSLLLRMTKFALPKRESKTSVSDLDVTEVRAEVHKSPEATRKSIMKYGVPVLPTPTNDGFPRLVSFNTPDDFENGYMRHEKRLKVIKQIIANLEIRISEFVGKRNGKHYNILKTALTQLVEELEDINEEELLDQVVMCHNYIKSCFNFLDSKAVDDIDDDVFTNYTDSKIFGSTHDLLDGHAVKTTAI